MKSKTLFVFIGIILILGHLSGICMGEETSGYMILVQGGNITLQEEGSNLILTIEDTNPYVAYLTEKSFIKPTKTGINTVNGSINAAIVRDGENNQSISIVSISNPIYSEETKELKFVLTPLEFYDGAILQNFADQKQDLTLDNSGNVTRTRVYLEINQKIPTNADVNPQVT